MGGGIVCWTQSMLGKHFTPDLSTLRQSSIFASFLFVFWSVVCMPDWLQTAIVDDPEFFDPPTYPHFCSAGFIGIHHHA